LLLFSQEMIAEADKDGDNEVNQEEFLRIMKKNQSVLSYEEETHTFLFNIPNLLCGQFTLVNPPSNTAVAAALSSIYCMHLMDSLSNKRFVLIYFNLNSLPEGYPVKTA